jgi:hypothetical protein
MHGSEKEQGKQAPAPRVGNLLLKWLQGQPSDIANSTLDAESTLDHAFSVHHHRACSVHGN